MPASFLVNRQFVVGDCFVELEKLPQVLYTGLNASISGAAFYFYTDSEERSVAATQLLVAQKVSNRFSCG